METPQKVQFTDELSSIVNLLVNIYINCICFMITYVLHFVQIHQFKGSILMAFKMIP